MVQTVGVRLNGRQLMASDEAGSDVELASSWRDGDVLDVDLPMYELLPFHKIARGYANLYWRVG